MDLQVNLFLKGCDRCAWWAKELDDTRRRTGWLTLPKALLDHLEEDHGVEVLSLSAVAHAFNPQISPGVPKLREVTGR